ncbi:hypothetical protein GN956_G10711 [Arapaima gigas]
MEPKSITVGAFHWGLNSLTDVAEKRVSEDEHLEVHRLHGYLNESYSVYWQQRRKVLMTLKTTPLKTVTTDVGHLEEEEEEEELRDKREAAVEMTSSHFPAQHVTSHSSTAHSLEQDLMVDDRTQQDRRQD